MDFVTLDFETANYSQNSACSIGLVKFLNGKVTDTYSSLIRPPKLYIRPDFTDIHGLTVKDVLDAPRFNALWESDILPFFGDLPFAAHNASFDAGVLKAVLEYYDLEVPALPYFCTCNLARRTWPQLKSHALTALAKHFNIIYKAHDALDDALTCGKLVLMSAEILKANNIKKLLASVRLEMKLLV